MGKDSEPLTDGPQLPRTPIQRRLLFEMAAIILLGAGLCLIFASARFSLGVLAGGILAFINFFWLDRSTKALFENAIAAGNAFLLSVKYILRYVLIGAVLAIFYITDAFPVVTVILGLASFALAVVFDGVVGIFTSSFKKEI